MRSTRDPIAELLSHAVEGRWTPGCAWWVEGPRGCVSRGVVGAAQIEPRRRRASEKTAWDLASLTKPLCTALLLALLESERRLDLDAPLSEHLETFGKSAFRSVSLTSLAAHTSGMPAWRPLYTVARSLPEYLERIANESPAVPEGETLYSDLGYVVLGAVLEQVTGQGLEQLFRERIAAPLGLRHIGFATRSRRFRRAAATEWGNRYERAMTGGSEADHAWRDAMLCGEVHDGNAHGLGGVAGHAGLFGRPADVAALTSELLRPRRLPLGPRGRDTLLRIVPGSKGRTVGLVAAGWSIAARGILPDDAPGHTGFTGTSIWLEPRGDRFFVLLGNRVHPLVPRRNFQWLRRGFHRLALRETA